MLKCDIPADPVYPLFIQPYHNLENATEMRISGEEYIVVR